MGQSPRFLRLAGLLIPGVRLTGRLLREVAGLRRARRAALAGFRRGLTEAGVPEEAAAALAEAYPTFQVGELAGEGRRKHAPLTRRRRAKPQP
jgi:hypothetical protein